MMKAALAGTASMKFLDVFEVAFGEEEDEENIPDITPTAAEEEEDLPAEAISTKGADIEFEQASTSAATKCTTRSSVKQPPVKKSCRVHLQRYPVPSLFVMQRLFFRIRLTRPHICTPVSLMDLYHNAKVAPLLRSPSTSATMHVHFANRARQQLTATLYAKAVDRPQPTSASTISMFAYSATFAGTTGGWRLSGRSI